MIQERDVLLTDREAAQYLKLSPKSGHITIKRMVQRGLLKAGRVGDLYRFRKRDLDDFVFSKS